MKKYTILSSDAEDSSDKNSNKGDKYTHNISNKTQVTPGGTLQASEGSKVHLDSQLSSQKKKTEMEDFSWDHIRTPSVKSDEEISYWITTAKAPCLCHYDKDIGSSFMSSTESFVNQLDDYHTTRDQPLIKKSTCVLDGKSYELPTYIPSNKYSNTQCKYNSQQFDCKVGFDNSKKSSRHGSDDFLSESHKECGVPLNSLKRTVEENSNEEMKCKITKYSQPLDNYDSGSSVLTANYIKYVNSKQADNMKQSKMRKKYLSMNSSSDSVNHFRRSESLGKDSGCVLQDKDNKILDSRMRNTLKPLCEKANSRSKKLYNMDNILKPSFEDTKQLNKSVFDNSKTSSSSVENSFNNDSKFFKHSSKASMHSADKSKLRSEESSFQQTTLNSNSSLPPSYINTSQMIFTKVETIQYNISVAYPPNVESHFSLQNSVADTYPSVKTDDVYKLTQNCVYNDF